MLHLIHVVRGSIDLRDDLRPCTCMHALHSSATGEVGATRKFNNR